MCVCVFVCARVCDCEFVDTCVCAACLCVCARLTLCVMIRAPRAPWRAPQESKDGEIPSPLTSPSFRRERGRP